MSGKVAAFVCGLAVSAAGVVLMPAARATVPTGSTGTGPPYTQGLKDVVQRALAAEQRALKAKTIKQAIAELKAAEKLLDELKGKLATAQGRLLPSAERMSSLRFDATSDDGEAQDDLAKAQRETNKTKSAALVKRARKWINWGIEEKKKLLMLIPAEVTVGCRVQTRSTPTQRWLEVLNCSSALTEIRFVVESGSQLPGLGPVTLRSPDGTVSSVTWSQREGVFSCPVALVPGGTFSAQLPAVEADTTLAVLLVTDAGVSFSAAMVRPPG